MDLLLQRQTLYSNCTIGNLFIDGMRECYVLEDKVREVTGQPISAWKVDGETAIPIGRYQVVADFSNRFQRTMPHILNVPGFDGIRIHSGNTDKDTEGCLLLGQDWDKSNPDFVGNSRAAFGAFFPRLLAGLEAGEVWITVASPTDLLLAA